MYAYDACTCLCFDLNLHLKRVWLSCETNVPYLRNTEPRAEPGAASPRYSTAFQLFLYTFPI